MKIAITADCHLRSDASKPERYASVQYILDRMAALKINTLIVAGDLFDKDANTYAEFEKLISLKKYVGMRIMAIRGNHDINISANHFSAPNFEVIDTPTRVSKDKLGVNFLFIPYVRNKKMAEVIEEVDFEDRSDEWVLVCHGNLIHGHRDINAYEQGVYMPLLSADMQRYKPTRVFIGHIHKPFDSTEIVIPGSPCGLDITESGKRSFVIFDTNTLEYEREVIQNATIFLDEQISIIPTEDEEAFIKNEIDALFSRNGIPEDERKLVTLRLKVNGYTSSVKNAKKVIETELNDMRKYKDMPIDLSNLKISNDVDRNFIINKFEEALVNEISQNNVDSAFAAEIMLNALDLVYGGE